MHKLTRPSSVPSPLIGVPPPQDGSVAWEDHWRTHLGQKAIVQLDLLCMQNELCAYCESKLEMDKGHIEHFRRKNKDWFPQLTFVWSNLYYSCLRPGTCGVHKDKVLRIGDVNKLIDPCADNPEDFLLFSYDGGVSPRESLSAGDRERAELTIQAFNLMHKDLRVARENQVRAYKWLESYPADEIDQYLDSLPRNTPHITAIYHYFNRRVV